MFIIIIYREFMRFYEKKCTKCIKTLDKGRQKNNFLKAETV